MKSRPEQVRKRQEPAQPAAGPGRTTLSRWFALAAGLFFGLCLLKFGNPVIMEPWVEAPANIYEFVLGTPWPLRWGYWLFAGLVLFALSVWKWRNPIPLALLLLPALWFLWQVIAAGHTVDRVLAGATVPHFAVCALCFYMGLMALGSLKRPGLFWAGLCVGFLLLVFTTWSQHFGGLEETRKYFWAYIYPTMDVYPTDYIKKISSNRVFGTLFYPNTLAACIILLFPVLTVKLWQWSGGGRFTSSARLFILGLWSVAALACLLWSGSKGGWLVMMGVGLIAFFRWPGIPVKLRAVLAVILVVAGLGGFFWTYSEFFKRGAPSVGARFDYWTAAVQNVNLKPMYGSGPGTFARPYAELKDNESEMSRMVHNDYLQQASDSGIPGFLLYSAFVIAALWRGLKVTRLKPPGALWESPELVSFAVWLGLAGWFLHSLIEFNLYIPALAWLAFLLLGWLLSNGCASVEGNPRATSSSNV